MTPEYIPPPDRGEAIDKKVHALVAHATQDALSRLKEVTSSAENKITTALERQLKPFIYENVFITNQLQSPEYQNYIYQELTPWLGTELGGAVCSDGRILAIAIFDPLAGRLHRRPRGMPEVRKSTKGDGKYTLDDTIISAGIINRLRRRGAENKEVLEFIGPHIHSTEPYHGCGAATAQAVKEGLNPKEAMQFGRIGEYFDELDEGFGAFDDVIARAGGTGYTFDMVHDIHSQGLIFGLRDVYLQKKLDPTKSLRQNLEDLHANKEILMTELLDDRIRADINKAMQEGKIGSSQLVFPLNIRNPRNMAKNMITIGRIARHLTEYYEEQGLEWIPDHLKQRTDEATGQKKKKPNNVLRTFAYTAIRNSVYRILGGIEPGAHELLLHPETVITAGPVTAKYNVGAIPFIEITPSQIRDSDIADIQTLYALAGTVLPPNGISLEDQGRVIVMTGAHTPEAYSSEAFEADARTKARQEVLQNAALVRQLFNKGVETGDTIVVGVLYHETTGELLEVVGDSTN